MKKKIIVTALSLLLLFTFYVQQNTYAAIDTDRETYCTITFSSGYQYDLWMTKRDSHECLGNFETVLFVYPAIDNSTVYAIARYFISSVPDSSSSTIFSWKSNFGSWGSDWNGQSLVMEPELSQNDIKDGQVISLTMSQITRKEGNPEPIIDGYDYLVECDSFDDFTKKREQLTNNDVNFDDIGVTGTTWTENGAEYLKVKYDLEVPLGFDSNTSQNHKYGLFANTGMFDSDKQDYTFKWYQSENVTKLPSYSDWELQFEISGFGNFRKILTPWDVTKFETPFLFLDSIPNFRNTYSTKFEDWSEIVDSYLSNEYDIPIDGGGYAYAYNTPNFRLRNVWNDNEKGITHYSNWILIQCKKDGTYTVTEVNSKDIEKDNVKTDDLVDNKKTDSIYDGVSNDDLADNGKESFFGNVKSFLNSIGYVPEFFTKIFSFLPDWCLTFVGFGFTIIVAIAVYKMVRG